MAHIPTYRYHAKHGAKLVKSAEELAKLPKDWHDCPSKAGLRAVERNYQTHFEKAEDSGEVAVEAIEQPKAPKAEGSVQEKASDSKPAGPKARKPKAPKAEGSA